MYVKQVRGLIAVIKYAPSILILFDDKTKTPPPSVAPS